MNCLPTLFVQAVFASWQTGGFGRLLTSSGRHYAEFCRLVPLPRRNSGTFPVRRQERLHRGTTRKAVVAGRLGGYGIRFFLIAPLFHGSEHHVGHGQQPLQQVRSILF